MSVVVTIYTPPSRCPACAATKRHLERCGIDYTEISIASDDNIIEAINELDLRTAPVVCASVNGVEEYWDGYRPSRIDAIAEAVAR